MTTDPSHSVNNERNTSRMTSKHKGGSKLERDDFDSGPVSLDMIEENLWLGNLKAACDIATLEKLKITHILTVDSVPLPRALTENTKYVTKFVKVADVPKENLISHFTETYNFIEEAKAAGSVLVHCYFGMSRSAAVVIAYLMSKYFYTYDKAFSVVKETRSITCPNSGFVAQLILYGNMECILDKDNPKYRKFRLKMAAENVRKVKILPQISADLVKPDPGLTTERPDPRVYRCRKCRRIVAVHQNIIPHVPRSVKIALSFERKQKAASIRDSQKDKHSKCDLACGQKGQILIERLKSLACGSDSKINESVDIDRTDEPNKDTVDSEDITEGTALDSSDSSKEAKIDGIRTGATEDELPEICVQTYFIEPLAWMTDIHKNVQGKLHCPKCANKLGSFSWTMGCQCPCGVKVAPAFYLVPSKVEKSNVVQNVQLTV